MTEGAPFDAGFPKPPRPSRRLPWLEPAFQRQIKHLNDAVPLALAGVMGLGVLVYFALPFEPGPGPTLFVTGLMLILAATQFGRSRALRWLTLLPALACVGFAASVWQAQRLGDHLLAEPVYGAAVTGTVHSILWRPDGPRFILSDLTSNHPALSPTLRSVQVKWRGNRPDSEAAGKQPRDMLAQRLEWNLTLLPVRESLMPGGFDFRRQAFFKGLSAYAYNLDAPTVLSAGQRSRTESWRQILRARFMKRLDGDAGGLATALVVGLRGDLSPPAEAQIRAAGLAHILAISGLHIGMVTGALFFLVRLLGAWVSGLSLRFHTHRIAAVVAVLGAFLYFTISGGSVPTQRATIVVALAMGAILLSRRPFSLRSVGIAALLVLVVQPSSLVTASFQMSFSAVIGLIVAFQFAEGRSQQQQRAPRRALNYVVGLSISSLIATAATGIFALYHFQQLSLLGIIANIIAVPLTALWIMPLLMLSALLVPLGAEGLTLWLAQFGLDGLLALSALVSQFDFGLLTTRDWPTLSLFLAGFGLWAGALLVRPWTLFAVLPAGAGIGLAMLSPLPAVIVDRGEGLLAYGAKAPFVGLGDRSGTVYLASGSGFAADQLGRYFNAAVSTCAMDTCVINIPANGVGLWLTTTPQIAAHLCQTKPQATGFTLAAAPRAACKREQAVDLRQIPLTGPRAFALESNGRVRIFQAKMTLSQRFWTMDPNL